jgi:hypothetical protein
VKNEVFFFHEQAFAAILARQFSRGAERFCAFAVPVHIF